MHSKTMQIESCLLRNRQISVITTHTLPVLSTELQSSCTQVSRLCTTAADLTFLYFKSNPWYLMYKYIYSQFKLNSVKSQSLSS